MRLPLPLASARTAHIPTDPAPAHPASALPVSICSFPVAIFVAAVMSVIADTARDPKRSRVLKPSDFDPFNKPSRPVKVGVSVLKDVFIDRQMPEIPAAVKEPRA